MDSVFYEASRFNVLADTIRVLIGDGHRIAREGLRQILSETPDIAVVAEATTANEVLAQVRAAGGADGLDLVLIDADLPGDADLDALRRLCKAYPQLPVLIIDKHVDRERARQSLRLGARGHLDKRVDPDAMRRAVRQCAGGGRCVIPVLG